jgi:hypothetical protein
LILHVSDVDRFWAYLLEKGFNPDNPHDASWGERYFQANTSLVAGLDKIATLDFPLCQ